MVGRGSVGILQSLVVLILLAIIFFPVIAIIIRKSRRVKRVEFTDQLVDATKSIFAEQSEKYVTSIGNGYIINFLNTGGVRSGFSVISDKRVYFKGKCYYKEHGKLKRAFEERTVDLTDVTGTGYYRVNPINLLITAAVSLVVGIAMTFIKSSDERLLVVFFLLLATSYITFILYFLQRENLFEIAFAGGSIGFSTYLYDKSEIDDFQKLLRVAKDNASKSNMEREPKHSVNVNNAANPQYGVAEEIKKYGDLLEKELITQEEFQQMKKDLLTKSGK